MPGSINEIKQNLAARIGQNVKVSVQAGRKRVNIVHGTLTKTYPAIFVVHLNNGQNAVQRVTYSYADLLTKNVSLDFE